MIMFPGLLAELELLHREKLSIRSVLIMGVLSIRKRHPNSEYLSFRKDETRSSDYTRQSTSAYKS